MADIHEALAEEENEKLLPLVSNGDHISSFKNQIKDSRDKKPISTGFNKLDESLGGGLHEGLYTLGAVSSLGKTSFILQLADNIAQQGHNVLFFSLEMARSELIAKSVSRHTLTGSYEKYGDTKKAKTTRDILDGHRYDNYSPEEIAGIETAIQTYTDYAGNIFTLEAVGNLGAKEISKYIQKLIDKGGRKPVVFVDYLQILAPFNEKYSDKQNTDKAVLELKRISRDYAIPVVVVSSFNRASYKEEKIDMSAFKESGAIEYSSDILIGLQSKTQGNSDPREIELVTLKNRNGKKGDIIRYQFYAAFNHFQED